MEHNLGERVCVIFLMGLEALRGCSGKKDGCYLICVQRVCRRNDANRPCTSARVTYRADNAGEARPMMDVPFTCETGIRL